MDDGRTAAGGRTRRVHARARVRRGRGRECGWCHRRERTSGISNRPGHAVDRRHGAHGPATRTARGIGPYDD